MLTKYKYCYVLILTGLIALLNHALVPIFGYRAVGLIFLMFVSGLGLFCSTGPVFLAAVFSALIWDFFFIPPYGTLLIHNTEDIVIILTFFVSSLCLGILINRVRQREQELQEKSISEKLYQVIFNSISHELKTPLTTIIGSAAILEAEEKLAGNALTLTRQVLSSAYAILQTVENLLDFSRVSSGILTLKKEWHDPEDVLKASLEQAKHAWKDRQLKIHLPPSLPLIRIDFTLFLHSIINILLNAARYSPPGSTIEVSLETTATNLNFQVLDQGPGIPKELQAQIFNKFYRLPQTAATGLGLGLSIAKEIIEMHQGQIYVENRVSGGAKFTVSLPLEKQPRVPLEE